MYPNILGAETPEDAQQRIYKQVLEQQAWALEQASKSNRAKYVILSIATTALVIAAVGGGTYYLGKNQRWWR